MNKPEPLPSSTLLAGCETAPVAAPANPSALAPVESPAEVAAADQVRAVIAATQ
jgi:hypothetical protein